MSLTRLIILLFLLSTFIAKAQDKYRYVAQTSPGLCSASLDLFKDHRYVYERGCEQWSSMNYGYWELKNDTLTLTQLDNKAMNVIDTVIATGNDMNDITITVLDKNGVDITENIWIGLRMNGKQQGVVEKTPEMHDQPLIFSRHQGSMGLGTLEALLQKEILIPITEASNYLVKLNITSEYIYNVESKWFDLGIAKFRRVGRYFVNIPVGDEPVWYFERMAK